MKKNVHAYNFRMRALRILSASFCLLSALAFAQQRREQQPGTDNKLPLASLWNRYSFQLQARGGVEPYHWHMAGGSLPRGIGLQENGKLSGVVDAQGQSEFTVVAVDANGKTDQQKFTLVTEPPLTAVWSRKSRVDGQRIDGSVKVSNTTGRDLDLTFVVLAVNDIGRATAIGYQHAPLKQNTRDLEIPFGDTLSPGNYVVNIDVVGEEPVSNMIFRSRLVSPRQPITQGP